MQTKSKTGSKKPDNDRPNRPDVDGIKINNSSNKADSDAHAVRAGKNPEGVIYVEQDSDIAGIVSSVKNSESKDIKIVAGKNGAGVFSGVNLKLVARAAKSKGREVAVITNDKKLRGLAGLAGLKSAVSLNAETVLEKPEGGSVEKTDADENMEIEGAAGIGGLAAKIGKGKKGKRDDKKSGDDKGKKRLSIPNFYDFRKKALVGLGVIVGILLILFLVMSSKKTAVVEVEANAVRKELNFTAALNPEAASTTIAELKAIRKEGSKLVDVAVPTSGQKDIGAKATGKITITNCTDNDVSVPSGTGASTNGLTYLTTDRIVIPASDFFSNGTCKRNGKKAVDIVAQESGTKYNIGSSNFNIANQPSTISASGDGAAGGTTEIIKVVAEGDVQTLKEKLQNESGSGYLDELKSQFTSEERPFEDTFKLEFGESQINPAVGEPSEEVRGKFTITYSIYGSKVSDIKEIMALNLEGLKDSPEQAVVKDGLDNLRMSGAPEAYVFQAAAYVGPSIDLGQIKESVVGAKKGEAIQKIKEVQGVVDARVSLKPFWVNTLPGKDKIEIKLKIKDVVE